MKSIAILLLLTASSTTFGAQVHKCTDAEGHTTFSGTPCGGVQVQVQYTPAGTSGSNANWWKTYSPEKTLNKQRRARELKAQQHRVRKAHRARGKAVDDFNHTIEDYYLTPSETTKPWEHGYCGVPGKAGVVRKQGRFQPKGCDNMPDWYGTVHY